MKRAIRWLAGLALLGAGSAVTAQSFNQEITRYRSARFDCAETFRRVTEGRCDAACRAAAERRQTQCLASAESRYAAALRRALRPRR